MFKVQNGLKAFVMYCLSRKVYVKELKIKCIFQTCCLEVSFRGMKLKKCKLPYIYFVIPQAFMPTGI